MVMLGLIFVFNWPKLPSGQAPIDEQVKAKIQLQLVQIWSKKGIYLIKQIFFQVLTDPLRFGDLALFIKLQCSIPTWNP